MSPAAEISSADALAQRVAGGDRAALAELFALHRPQLRRLVELRVDARLAGRLDPDDVLQEAYLAAQTRLHHCTADTFERCLLWLRLITRQTLVDLHRRHLGAQQRDAARERALPRAGSDGSSATLAELLAASVATPTRLVRHGELAKKLRTALEQMDPVDREVLTLRHFEGLSNARVAAELGLQQKAASIRYVRALRRLREALADEPGFTDVGKAMRQALDDPGGA